MWYDVLGDETSLEGHNHGIFAFVYKTWKANLLPFISFLRILYASARVSSSSMDF